MTSRLPHRTSSLRLPAILTLIVLAACGGGGDGDGGPGPQPTAPVASVTIAPGDTAILMSSTGQLRVTLKDADGNVLAGRTVTWSSSNASAATVAASGLVSGLQLGTATITATSEEVSASVVVSIIPRIILSPRLPSLFAGDTVQLHAALLTQTNAPAGSATVSWSASPGAAGTVGTTGIVSGTTPGTLHVTATAAGAQGTVDVVVLKRPGTLTRKVAWRLDDAVRTADGAKISELWVSNPDGSNAVRVSPAEESVDDFAWSPNGDRLLVSTVAYNGLGHSTYFVVTPDGTVLADFHRGGTRPDWSPDGLQVVFTQGNDLYIINADGTGARPLRVGTGQSNLAPKWSPDGRTIAYRRQVTFCDGISIVDVDGSNNTVLSLPTGACELDWSLDGKLVAYTSFMTSGGVQGIFTVPASGGTVKAISSNCTSNGTCAAPNHYLWQWLPDGDRLMEETLSEYWTYHVLTGARTLIGTAGTDQHIKTWSPDMTKVLFTGVEEGIPRVGVMNADLTTPVYISPAGRQGGESAWQPAP